MYISLKYDITEEQGNFLLDFPGSSLKEDALYYKFNSEYNLAILSIKSLKQQRIANALADYKVLVNAFPETKFLDEATELKEELGCGYKFLSNDEAHVGLN